KTLVTYGFGWASWERELMGRRVRTLAFVPEKSAARVLIISVRGSKPGDRIFWSTDLVLGAGDEPGRQARAELKGGVFSALGEISVTARASAAPISWSCDRRDIAARKLTKKPGIGENCAFGAEYPAGDLVLTLGSGSLGEYGPADYNETVLAWERRVLGVRIETPCSALDDYMNGWSLYQVLSSRVLGRTGLYQCGGAFGFRDQLQDALALTLTEPETTRALILAAAGRQYEEGDVQHWWHSPGSGVRTRISDDYLWLCHVLCRYVERTGDREILQEQVPFISSPPLREEEHDRYEEPVSGPAAALRDHAERALALFRRRGTGPHGLALMLSGDWNDGFDRVGAGGRGESVWLTFFAAIVFEEMGRLLDKEEYGSYASRLKKAAADTFTGDRFARAYYDDGAPMGTPESPECSIDSLAQSFAVFAGIREKQGLDAALRELFDRENNIVKLFTPAFSEGDREPGYVKSYAPGFRENGGQYTHAAVWLAMALIRAGRTQEGWQVLRALLPGDRDPEVYRAEPYVMAADVYTARDNVGRGGWTWYTGSAGWYRQAVLGELFGICQRGGRLFVEPHMPPELLPAALTLGDDFRVEYLADGRVLVNGSRPDPAGYRKP
ncbi:MAG: hypothetical protein II794_08435, partial [Oscillospiraceae bacterium]|nr:hypothetical protein [Oscillospiraceae bacterium]